jgi:hypothetical protein
MPSQDHWWRPATSQLARLGLRALVVWTLGCIAAAALLIALVTATKLLSGFPLVIQLALGVLLLLAVVLIAGMLRERRAVLQAHHQFLKIFDSIKPLTANEKTTGLSPEKMAEIRRRGNMLRGLPKDWWLNFEESLELYTPPGEGQGWFLTRPVREVLTEDDLVFRLYHASFHQAVPTILTALGLLATFIAILQGLAGVTYNETDPLHPISGIDTLINGLAGKFLSSILALLLSVLFTFIERKICERQISQAYDEVVHRCKEIFPFLSQSRILLDVQRLLRTQQARSGGVDAAISSER